MPARFGRASCPSDARIRKKSSCRFQGHRSRLESFRRLAVWRNPPTQFASATGNLTALNYNIFLAIASGKREIKPVMKQPQRTTPKKPDYPAETPGSRLAAKARKLANKLT